MPSQSSTMSVKDLRDLLKSVFLLALKPGELARQIAEQAAGPDESYLRGKDAFDRAYAALTRLGDSTQDGKLLLKQANGAPSAAGAIVSEWTAARAERKTVFDEVGADGPTILVVQVSGIDESALWKEDANHDPLVVKGTPDALLRFFETTPSLQMSKEPDERNGVFQSLHGDKVSVKRRGNTSRWDPKVNLTVALDHDAASGFPKQLNLLNCIRDPSYQRVRLSWALLGEARCPCEPCAYAELTLNGRYRGTYVAMPSADEYYFESQFPGTSERAVFRGQYGDIAGGATLALRGDKGTDYFIQANRSSRTYEPRLDTTDAQFDDLARFIKVVNSGDAKGGAFADALRSRFDVEAFLRTMAVINLLGAWDNYYLNAQNYFLHFASSEGSRRCSFCAYDMDSVLGVSWPGQKRNWQEKDVLFRGTELGNVVLAKRVLENALFRNYYCDFMAWFLEQRFTPTWFTRKRNSLWACLERTAYLESSTPYGPPDTARPWTNDQVYRHAVLDKPFDAPSSSSVAGLQVLGIADFLRQRREKVLSLLKVETLGQSKVDFDSAKWSFA